MKILIIGHGRMGSLIEDIIKASDDMSLVGIIDINNTKMLSKLDKISDIIVDFSHPDMLPLAIDYASRTGTAFLSGTTGIDEVGFEQLRQLGEQVPVLHSANYSLGIAVLSHVLPQIKAALEGFDVEIIETHHNKKLDSPSGTAVLLANSLDPNGDYKRVYGREGFCGQREKNEIGIHAVRGGTVTGKHTVGFFGKDEILEITHEASSRQILAEGALAMARRLVSKDKGFYTLSEILFGGETHERAGNN